ncbi:integrase protein-related [Anaeramoeba flamelloides]|uniref:Integrase protein-related n=2 Tax=Anaeramoeba flamelloides TaxID=1746091 RepID=A0AAV7ZXS3_9EUKA|nr:integrase protein-related [Anaeramoeba flamelloides]
MLPEEQLKRVKSRGRKARLKKWEIEKVGEWIDLQNQKGIICGGHEVINFINKNFNYKYHKSSISRILQSIGYSSRKTQTKVNNQLIPSFSAKIETKRKEINEKIALKSNNKNFNVWVMDEKGIWNHHPARYTYTRKSNPKPWVKGKLVNSKDTLTATVSYKGEIPDLFWIKSVTKTKKREKVSGMNVQKMLEYVDHFLTFANSGDILLMDNLRSHHNIDVKKKLEDSGIEVIYFTPNGASHLSPLDNAAFKILEDKLRKNGGRRFANYFDKIVTVNNLWKSIPNGKIINQFKKSELPYYNEKFDKIMMSRSIN